MHARASRKPVLSLVLLASLASPSFAAPPQVAPEDWGYATAQKLAAFLPASVPGLVERMPWDPDDYAQVRLDAGCGEMGCPVFAHGSAMRHWRVADPALAQHIDSLNRRREELVKRAEGLGRNARPEDYVRMGDELAALDERIRGVQDRAAWVTLEIGVNFTPQDQDGPEAKPVGTLKGYPLYRYPWEGEGARLSVYLGLDTLLDV